jgi:hypothetical protein
MSEYPASSMIHPGTISFYNHRKLPISKDFLTCHRIFDKRSFSLFLTIQAFLI